MAIAYEPYSNSPTAYRRESALDTATLERGPRRILFLDHTATLGGGEIALLNLVTNLDLGRYKPVVVLCSDGPLASALRDSGTETHILPLSPSIVHTRKDTLNRKTLTRGRDGVRLIGYVARLARFIRKHNIELVHANSLKADVIGALAARLARVPVLWHVRDRIEDDYLPPKVVKLFRLLCRVLPNYVVANSNATLGTLSLRRTKNACAVYSGVNMHGFNETGQGGGVNVNIGRNSRVVHDGVTRLNSTRIGADYSLPSTALQTAPRPGGSPWFHAMGRGARIGLVGRISPWKGQHVFIKAAAQLRHRYPNARFQIIGSALFNETDYERDLHELTASLGMEERIEFTGFRRDIQTAIADLDILVHASTTGEPFGQVVAEGMANGKPVIATCGGGVPEIVVNGVTGLLIPMDDVEAMAAAMGYLLDNPEEALAMGAAGHKRADTHFNIENTARLVETIYEEMLAGRKSTSKGYAGAIPEPTD